MTSGYYRFPTVHADTVVFVSEDDLWRLSIQGGIPYRLTSNLGEVTYPMLSPDGQQLAFVGREEGAPEVYVMPALGGQARRLTYQSSDCRVVGWSPDGTQILYSSAYGQAHPDAYSLFQIAAASRNGAAQPLPYGLARAIAFGPPRQENGAQSTPVVLGRNTGEPARWKRYQGGTAGLLWIDPMGDGQFQRLLPTLRGNIACPMWIFPAAASETEAAGRIYFISDHEGIGNLYSCRPDGLDLQRHTDHEDYYARNPTSDGRHIVYHAGADLYLFSLAHHSSTRIDVDYRSPRVQRNRKFVNAARDLQSASLNPKGTATAITTRGKAYTFYNHEGPVFQTGRPDTVRYRLAHWMHDGHRLVMVSDEPGEEVLEVHAFEPGVPPRRFDQIEFGRAVELKPSPTAERVALSNHRHELLIIDLTTESLLMVDRSPYRRIAGFDWSPDGRWLAYGFAATAQTTAIRLYRLPDPQAEDESLRQGAVHTITQPLLHDVQPAFDPRGRYLYFLSHRVFNPIYDGLHFDLGFPLGMRPYLITLQANLPNPFVPHPEDLDEEEEPDETEEEATEELEPAADGEMGEEPETGEEEEQDEDGDEELLDEGGTSARLRPRAGRRGHSVAWESADRPGSESGEPSQEDGAREPKQAKDGDRNPITIDLEGIHRRMLAFPVAEGRFGQIAGLGDKVLFTARPVRGSLDDDADSEEEESAGDLECYIFKEFRTETLASAVSWFVLSANRKKLLYWDNQRLRVISAGEKAPRESGTCRKSGWIDLSRVKVWVDAQSEWEQMVREAWRLQRDHFWSEDMAQVDWQQVYTRYFPLIERLSSRSEFSDLMWEMQGELGTSHAYEFGGDYRPRPVYGQGFLGADLSWSEAKGGYEIGELLMGDPWDPQAHSPLADPGVDIRPGDVILGINGQPVDAHTSPAQHLVNQAGQEVLLVLASRENDRPAAEPAEPLEAPPAPARPRTVVVRTLGSETPVRYRAWVEANRLAVHTATSGQVGYVHIPDMGPRGYAEFHRGYLSEVDREALIVDVRFNAGGHVSQLILEKLARRRLGYDLTRWGGVEPYPSESVAGPIVAISNEYAGSDGDIFCHSFKMLKLGPLVGMRTWGGVVGIWPRHALVDGTVTTQPEFSFWFMDVGWNLENYGTDPDIEVDITPQDYAANRDNQLERAIQEVLRLLQINPPLKPDLSQRPSRALPKLPARNGR